MSSASTLRIAWVLPAIGLGAFWQPVVKSMARNCQKFVVYTGRAWYGFDPADPENAGIEVVGTVSRITTEKDKSDYSGGVMFLSHRIIFRLFDSKPDVVFCNGFSIWTAYILLLKPIRRWRVVIAWEGSSPNVDFRTSTLRQYFRRTMVGFADGLIANNQAARRYLVDFLGAPVERVRTQTYLVPDYQTLQRGLGSAEHRVIQRRGKTPIFLTVGRIEKRKGIEHLIRACAILRGRGIEDFRLVLVGGGPERTALESQIAADGLSENVEWAGWVNYNNLGGYFRDADVLIFPTLEDTWGMVVPEAMVFGKPILCSRNAGASELVHEGRNGYTFDPRHPEGLAEHMLRLIEDSQLVERMGRESSVIIEQYSPNTAAEFFTKVAQTVSTGEG